MLGSTERDPYFVLSGVSESGVRAVSPDSLGSAALRSTDGVELGVSREETEEQSFILDLRVTRVQVDELLSERVSGTGIRPSFVLPEDVHAPEAYKRLQGKEQKDGYRVGLLSGLLSKWQEEYGIDEAELIGARFQTLSSVIQDEGALVFGDLIHRDHFGELVQGYDELMRQDGSVSLLHSYANLRNQPDFLANPGYNRAFLHPLVVALISDRVGGAVRLVDARAKDAGPISVRAQDNMLHIDNTPYRDEYKVLVAWEKGQPSGPKGQNFVYLPGTHKGVRDSIIGPDGTPHSTENASIFIHPEDVTQVFDLQQRVRPGSNAVVEVHDEERPITIAFPSGSVVHHRLRTERGHSRSSLILAFHRSADTPGEFIGGFEPAAHNQDLEVAIFGLQDTGSDDEFCRILATYSHEIAEKITEIFSDGGPTVTIDAQAKTLPPDEMEEWFSIATDAPTVEDIKQRANYFHLGSEVRPDDFLDLLGGKMMLHDKHGPIDMILYVDGHEEPRKWARNRIREMREDTLQQRLVGWKDEIRQPEVSDLLTIAEMGDITKQLAEMAATRSSQQRREGHLDPIERISPEEAYRSVEQLIIDLGENLTRAEDRQTYISASLFQFWACDELNRLMGTDNQELRVIGGRLLRNYVVAAILVEKQIAFEKSE